jgi:hypothetical protein
MPEFKLGICGEYRDAPKSMKFCYNVCMNQVRWLPLRDSIARLTAAQAALKKDRWVI